MRRIAILLAALAAVVVAAGCVEEDSTKIRNASVKARTQTFARAQAAAPLPRTVNFPQRKALVEFTERQDLTDHPWYVYVLADTGNVLGYYVAKTVPINACNFLSSTEEVHTEWEGTTVLTAPSLDGIYYGGAGASSGCDAWFFFDSATNALIQIRGVNFFTADQPLRLDAKPIRVERTR